MRGKIGVVYLCTNIVIAAYATSKIPLLIIDTDGNPAYYDRNIQLIANTVGFTPQYKNLYQILQTPLINKHYNALMCIINGSFIAYMNQAPAQYSLDIIKLAIKRPHSCIGFIVPSIEYSPQFTYRVLDFIKQTNIFTSMSSDQQKLITEYITHYLSLPEANISALFGTTLLNKSPHAPPTLSTIKPLIDQSTNTMIALSIPVQHAALSSTIIPSLPLGILIQLPHDSLLFISKSSLWTSTDMIENFIKTPFHITIRNKLLAALQQTLHELSITCKQRHMTSTIMPQSIKIPAQCTEKYIMQEKRKAETHFRATMNTPMYAWCKKSISCAWLDPLDFFAHEDSLQKFKKEIEQKKSDSIIDADHIQKIVEEHALARGIKFIYDAGFNMLWFEFVPEWYFSQHGIRKNQKDIYSTRIRALAVALTHEAQKRNIPMPKLFVGMNLTSNFASYPVKNPVQNIYGTMFSKIPAPLDRTYFWQPEVLDVFDAFYTAFEGILPIDGVFFDFEMYHAQDQLGGYLDTMDFSNQAWHRYCTRTANNSLHTLESTEKRVDFLQKNKKFDEYFTVLEQDAYELGRYIKKYMRSKIPNLLFGAYAPTLPRSWFYRGILRGLSSKHEPVIYASFNTDYYSHYRWLRKHNIHLLHLGPCMLSKLQSPNDATVLHYLHNNHYGIWYNRPSRMIYGYNQQELGRVWWGIEASPLPADTLAAMIKNNNKHYNMHTKIK